MIAKLNPQYKFFSNHEIPSLHCHVKDNIVLPSLRQASNYAITTDLWTSSAAEPYTTMTVHSVNNEWNLQSI